MAAQENAEDQSMEEILQSIKKIIAEEQVHQLNRNCTLFPNYPQVLERAYFRRGIIALENNDYDQAIEDFEIMLKHNPNHAVAKSHLLRAKDSLREYKKEQRRKLKGKLF